MATGNSDCPVTSGNIMQQIYSAVMRETMSGQILAEEERISVMDAIKLYTINAAYANFDESILGSIEPGKLADLVVLSEDPTVVNPRKIKDIKVEITIINGKVVYENRKIRGGDGSE
jgi:predicted amidohydrolase YtcJ